MISILLPPRNPFIIKREKDTDRVGQEDSGKKLKDSKTYQRVEGDWQLPLNETNFFSQSFWSINGLDQLLHWQLKMANCRNTKWLR